MTESNEKVVLWFPECDYQSKYRIYTNLKRYLDSHSIKYDYTFLWCDTAYFVPNRVVVDEEVALYLCLKFDLKTQK